MHFVDLLMDKIDEKKTPCCVGLDPNFLDIPEFIRKESKVKYGETFEAIGNAFFEFNRRIIDAVSDIVPVVKPQIAFYEQYGYWGIKAFMDSVNYAKNKGLVVIADAKRNDISSTAKAYSDGHIGEIDYWNGKRHCFDEDAITVNAYLGSDGVQPFIENIKKYGKGIFVLVKTSNPSSGDFQDIITKQGVQNYVIMAQNVSKWGEGTEGDRGYVSVGAVVGATYPQEAKTLRSIMKKAYFLVPGYGAQGGSAEDVLPCFNDDGYGAIVNSSRGIIFAYKKSGKPEEFDSEARKAAMSMAEDINKALKQFKK